MKDVASDQPVFQRRKRRDAVENRERILNVARHLFATQGVDATSMNEIAQVAQVGPGTLYRCFAHKGALGEALLTEEIAAFWRQVDATLFPDAPGSALSQLDWFLDALLRMTESHMPLFAVLLEVVKPRHDFQRQSRNFSRERILAGMRRLFIDGLRVHSQQATDTGGKG